MHRLKFTDMSDRIIANHTLLVATTMAWPARNGPPADPDIVSDSFLVGLFGWTKCHGG
jgi:hypothetical protein